MNIAGIIAEYDPFHNGHKHHIDRVRDAGVTHIVAVISGSFTQRGEPALLTKFERTEMALANGVDLVLELPLPFAMASAERFAEGGVATLHALGCIDTLSFGSECGDVAKLCELAALIDTPAYTAALKTALGTGIPYAAARQQAAAVCGTHELAGLLDSANNTLGLEYIRASKRLDAPFTFHTIRRVGTAHNATDTQDAFASASHLRALIRNSDIATAAAYLPSANVAILRRAMENGTAPSNANTLDVAVLTQLRQLSAADFAALPYVSEGLENRLYQASRTAKNVDELLDAVKTRRYPLARLRRILWAALLKLPHESAYPTPEYIRILGMNERGREILSSAKPTLPIVSRAAHVRTLSQTAQDLFALECRATDLHALTLPNPPSCATDMAHKIITI